MFHIAQVNIGRMLAPLDSPTMAGFMARLADINALADSAPGFVWRLQTESGDATSVRVFDDDRIAQHVGMGLHRGAVELLVQNRARARDKWSHSMVRAAEYAVHGLMVDSGGQPSNAARC